MVVRLPLQVRQPVHAKLQDIKEVAVRHGDKCLVCDTKVVIDGYEHWDLRPTIVLYVPKALGGISQLENKRIAHTYCGARRGVIPVVNNPAWVSLKRKCVEAVRAFRAEVRSRIGSITPVEPEPPIEVVPAQPTLVRPVQRDEVRQCYGKIAFGNFKQAQQAADSLNQTSTHWVRAYPCPFCELYHIGRTHRINRFREPANLHRQTWGDNLDYE